MEGRETRIERAELLSVGSELLVGETRDTNSGDLARWLTELGVEVTRASAVPDRLEVVSGAIADGLRRSDLVISTGGLGPTPDDLTREAICRVLGLEPFVDAELEAWLRGLWTRRGVPFVAANLKQAWLVQGAQALPNPNGTAPGWWVDAPTGLIIALPGPPREMHPMWRDQVVPRLLARGLGSDHAAETLRLTGIGESALADLIGEDVLRRRNPEVATYARAEAVDVRISAVAEGGRSARELVDAEVARLMPSLEAYVFARGSETWAEAIGRRLGTRRAAYVEIATGGTITDLLGTAPWLACGELLAPDTPLAHAEPDLRGFAQRVRASAGVDVGLAVRVRDRDRDAAVTVAVALDGAVTEVTRTAFIAGEMGRRRAAVIAAAELWARLGQSTGQ